ncbi:hypothetical protein NBRC116599_42050 [Aquicoccus sp. SU-CL01552]
MVSAVSDGPELIGDLLRVMRQVAEESMTMVVVTHEVGFARELAGRVLFLEGGAIVEEGTAQAVLRDP